MRSWLFDGQGAELATQLGDMCGTAFHLADFPSGHRLFGQGEPGDRVYVIISGLVKMSCTAAHGSEVVRDVKGPGDVVGELSMFDPGPRSETATCQTLVRTGWLTSSSLRRLAHRHPDLAQRWLQALSRQVQERESEIAGVVAADVATRVARQIVGLADRFGEDGQDAKAFGGIVHVYHSLTRHEFAQLAGARREAVSQALAKFVERGWLVTTPGGFDVYDLDALRRRAQGAFPDVRRGWPA
ncbi:Crp/Fnr family transcriptional regulator [Mycolicibacterium sp. J2]|jgi:CRP-like cAMP-binding protein|uniref:Crp/Fnr family transcriptional regulator n=1 Tax=Mycolicibacterium sp. J2 TaxID=2993511 RepID=UPI00224B4A42|nr:Crp/Fnr family transcriptional regulator [Mycolicibacterium sp. J2]MCX2715616.1 Crp/Fnr family transcriptional regulator [Mycolicibacterium sp. J2]